ncbi:hypothetical protein MHB50_14830 [Siminovitchia sp. FSL H7-0308]|uniref:hypothetical protein n=1 Tax=Siminovitchia sp. FSL H7-0308 TaxID=2921432 RepID=UPI0030EE2AC4
MHIHKNPAIFTMIMNRTSMLDNQVALHYSENSWVSALFMLKLKNLLANYEIELIEVTNNPIIMPQSRPIVENCAVTPTLQYFQDKHSKVDYDV